MCKGPLLKAFIGLVIFLVGIGLFVDQYYPVFGTGIAWTTHFLNLLKGLIPPFLVLLGLFIMWLEIDEWKIEKEIKKEEAEEVEEEKEEGEKKEEEKVVKRGKRRRGRPRKRR